MSLLRKAPRQQRSRDTVAVILDAAARVLTRRGYAAFTTNAVAEAAGVSVGSLYQYFPNKAALIAALSARHLEDIEATLAAGLSEVGRMPLADLVRMLIEANIAAHLLNPQLHAVLSDQLPHQGDADWRLAFEARARAAVREILRAYRAEIDAPDLELAAYVVMRSVEACIHDAWRRCPEAMVDGRLAAAVTKLVLGYLR